MSVAPKYSARYAARGTAWIWLAVATLALICTHGNWIIALAGWLYPFCLLRFTRSQHPLLGFLVTALLLTASGLLLLIFSAIPFSVPFVLVIFVSSCFLALPFLLDRLLTQKWSSWVSTLLFPLGYVAVSYLKGLADPLGSLGSLAYTQYGDLPLLQLLSMTGISGILFIMTWFASLGNWIIEQDWAWPKIRRGVMLYMTILALIFVGGYARLLFSSQPATVRVASLGTSAPLYARAAQGQKQALKDLNARRATPAELAALRSGSTLLLNDLLARTHHEAQAGAKIVLWPECGILLLQADEQTFLGRLATAAHQDSLYLDIGVCILNDQYLPNMLDQSILFNPQGQISWRFEKAHPVPGLDSVVAGNGVVPVVSTPYGRLSTVICFDEDFPALLQQAGRSQAAILLAPSNDWQEIDPWHTNAITFRAIEEGFSLVRETNNGLSVAIDPAGRTLASVDYFHTDPQSMVALVPTQGTETLYARVGDAFAWLCCLVWLALGAGAIVTRRKRLTTKPNPEPGTA
ncbi:nitrilase [Ktedonosporobacter rubrisoli]|uniref:Nitrilase n=1 Tax=Ktedonosporobacter rubrisoli TaxID=2509675 RepID=A0A4V0YZU8_KTERU|nr:nitrilase-related carbon-nitrogen hydrolase [Ktedonosporobacter rubrisoli]QBD80971.1 nitrilase [Ktedonosporobacter rubrisoli]